MERRVSTATAASCVAVPLASSETAARKVGSDTSWLLSEHNSRVTYSTGSSDQHINDAT